MSLVLPKNPNVFANSPLDRAAHLRTNQEWLASAFADKRSLFIPVWKLMPFLIKNREGKREAGWVTAELALPLMRPGAVTVFLGLHKDCAHFAIDISGLSDPTADGALAGLGEFADLRMVAEEIDIGDAAILAQAKSIIDWHQRHGFCANCGGQTESAEAGYKRYCETCNTEHFPRTDPVVIMLALNGDSCLLGRQAKWPNGFYSALAGFIEPGESIEEAVARELQEEAGIKTAEVLFFSTQPWPYPSSLMIGCFARAASTEITIDGNELSDAQWFPRAKVREALLKKGTPELRLPPPLAIAHQLVKSWVEQE
ncbi:MAG: NAD(+) diphosphatase [Alphaproteobacteria bacterium]|nr:NAD(+) diphosphatase [Alphaproteobacteria bacterium]